MTILSFNGNLYTWQNDPFIEMATCMPFQYIPQHKHSFAGRCFDSPYYKLLAIYMIDLLISARLVPL